MADSLTVLFVPPDYFSAERLVNRIQRTLNTIKKDNKRVSRILFSSLSQIGYNSPMFAVEPLLIAALIELFKKEGATSLFINTTSGDGIESANLFDMMIFSEKIQEGQDYDVRLVIHHHGPSKVDRQPHLLGMAHSKHGDWAQMKLGPAIPPQTGESGTKRGLTKISNA